MYPFAAAAPRIDRSMIPGLALGGAWFAGVSLGLLAARFYGGSVVDLSLAAGGVVPSFWGTCLAAMLPLFLSAFAVFFFYRAGAYLFCTVRGGCIGFMLGCFVSAGGLWLGALLIFSGLFAGPVLLWFLRRRLALGAECLRGDICCCLTAAAVIAAVDRWVVAPFLVHALSF